MSSRRFLFVCSCIALITSAFTFVVRGDVMQDMGNAFSFNQEQKGSLEGAVFVGMALSMLGGGFICDLLGMKRIMYLACASHLLGSLGTILAPRLLGTDVDSAVSFKWLYFNSILMGCGNGLTEVAINPLIATLYADKKTHYLNILHAWWPGGLVIGGLSAVGIRWLVTNPSSPMAGVSLPLELWQISLCLIVLPAIIYGVMLTTAKFPSTERVASGVSNSDMFKECLRPMFLLWAVCMLMTAATELGPQKWQESVMQSTAGISGTLILVYTSGMMFVLRHFAGPIAHAISPTGMLAVSSVLAGVGLFLLSYANSAATAFAFATIFGLGIAYFWPTMLGVTAERFPKGGALAMALMGSVGNLAISQVLPQMGRIVDNYAVAYVEENSPTSVQKEILNANAAGQFTSINAKQVETLKAEKIQPEVVEVAASAQGLGYRMAFRWVSILPVVLVTLFTAIILYDRSRGGYKPEILISREEENELMSGGAQGAVE